MALTLLHPNISVLSPEGLIILSFYIPVIPNMEITQLINWQTKGWYNKYSCTDLSSRNPLFLEVICVQVHGNKYFRKDCFRSGA